MSIITDLQLAILYSLRAEFRDDVNSYLDDEVEEGMLVALPAVVFGVKEITPKNNSIGTGHLRVNAVIEAILYNDPSDGILSNDPKDLFKPFEAAIELAEMAHQNSFGLSVGGGRLISVEKLKNALIGGDSGSADGSGSGPVSDADINPSKADNQPAGKDLAVWRIRWSHELCLEKSAQDESVDNVITPKDVYLGFTPKIGSDHGDGYILDQGNKDLPSNIIAPLDLGHM